MNLNAITLAITRPGGVLPGAVRAWDPLSLFLYGDQGIWLDPSDLTTMFQDSAGTTPVTAVEQPVGLILDKSKGLVLGSQLVNNGDFSNGTTGWTATNSGSTTPDSGGYRITNTISGASTITQPLSTTSGKWYCVTLDVLGFGGGASSGQVRAGTTAGAFNVAFASIGLGLRTFYFLASSATTFISVAANSGTIGAYGSYDNISVKELPGNHAFQSTNANRPTLSARYNQYVGTEALATQNVTTLATSYTLKFSGPGSITLSGTATGIYTAGTYTVTCTAGTLTSTVSGSVTQASLVTADQSSLPYQRVNTATDYDSDATKFPRRINYAAGQSMTVSFPANLGSSCVVARANPGVSAVIAENQTVNTPLTLNTNHSGLVITSRSISVDEKARLDEYLDKKAIAK